MLSDDMQGVSSQTGRAALSVFLQLNRVTRKENLSVTSSVSTGLLEQHP